jgi:methionyl-tRNA formyltransferase
MRLVFLGTPAFAVPSLEKLVAAGHDALLVVTQPDRPLGRGLRMAISPVKHEAIRLRIPVAQPERVRRPEAVETLRSLAPDIMVVVGYGQIIPQSVIDIPRHGIVNLHASLLPKYRGAAPIQWAIANGETRTGVTTMRIDAGLDTGDILLARETEIGLEETAVELGARLAQSGADLLVETLDEIEAGSLVPRKQDSSQATLAPILKKEDGLIDWSRPAESVHNLIRGMQPWPGAYTLFRGQSLRIWRACFGSTAESAPPGRFVRLKPLTVACGEGALELLEVQLEGRRRMSAADFANGHRLTESDILGEALT